MRHLITQVHHDITTADYELSILQDKLSQVKDELALVKDDHMVIAILSEKDFLEWSAEEQIRYRNYEHLLEEEERLDNRLMRLCNSLNRLEKRKNSIRKRSILSTKRVKWFKDHITMVANK